MNNDTNKKCLACQSLLVGRSDKKFCDQYCKSNYQYQQIKSDSSSIHYRITKQLRKNRSILKKLNKAGKATIRSNDLTALGFNPRIFTHYWKSSKGKTYLFVFDYGFMKIRDNNKFKYSIVQWQAYMEKQISIN